MTLKSKIKVDRLTIPVHIGVTELERQTSQKIHVIFFLDFKMTPEAIHTDNLVDTICYASLSSKIVQLAKQQEYKTIENLAYKIYALLKKEAPGAIVKVTVEKPEAEVECLDGAVKFILGDSLC